MQSTLILDKSTFQALSRHEHVARWRRYRENIPPVLLREILADLAKTTASPGAQVQSLAAKFLGSGGVINANYRLLCMGELTGLGHFKVDGRPVLSEYTEGTEPDGSRAILVEPTEGNLAVLRWAGAEFAPEERDAAVAIRARHGSFSLDALARRLRAHHVLIPRPKRADEIPQVATEMLARHALQAPLLDWLIEQLRLEKVHELSTLARWERGGRPFLDVFAPYAVHCCKCLLMLLVGMRHRLLTSRPTNRVDVEYLFYLPFCNVFASGDRLHAQLAPALLRPAQRFMTTDELKQELATASSPELDREPRRA